MDRYRLLMAVLDDVQERLRAALAAGDLHRYAEELCERAWVELHVRDMWRPGSYSWHRWDGYVRADWARAVRAGGYIEWLERAS